MIRGGEVCVCVCVCEGGGGGLLNLYPKKGGDLLEVGGLFEMLGA